MQNKRGKIVLWALSIRDVCEHLKSSEFGLASSEAARRRQEYGQNEIINTDRKTWPRIFSNQFRSPLVLLLLFAALASYFLGEKLDSLVILAIIAINSLLGFFQEHRAENTMKKLSFYVSIEASVLRDRQIQRTNAKNIVPGDIVFLKKGDVVPADVRLISAENLTTDESSVTGESTPVLKKASTINKEKSLPQYLTNVLFTGTSITSGSGHGIVIATGSSTLFGKTASCLTRQTESEFERGIKTFSGFLLKITLVMTLFIFIANFVLGKGGFDSFLFAIALAVGITPEALPIVMTIALSDGALKMAKKEVIIKKLTSVEDLGNIDTICADKTGTLTEGKFSLARFVNLGKKEDNKVLLYAMICNSIKTAAGKDENSIDSAILKSRAAQKLQEKRHSFQIISENEFDFSRRRMSVLARSGSSGESFLIAKGAPESIISQCTTATCMGKKAAMTRRLKTKLGKAVAEYEKEGFVTIAVADKKMKKNSLSKSDEKKMQLLGFLLFQDPAKKTAKRSIKLLHKLGVNVKVISGDSPIITRKICSDVGLKIAEDNIITGDELDKLSDEEFESHSIHYNVFARVTPEHKYRIVSALNREGNIVGFLGDGVNDAPALKAADVGISVNTGTGVAKEAANIILLRKSLEVLADGIIEGRKTFGNITKYVLNTISANYGNMFTVAVTSLFLKFIPLKPSQILLTNLVTDLPMLTVSTDNVDEEMLKKPKRWNLTAIYKFMMHFGILSSIFDLLFILPLIFIFKASPELFRTAWFLESSLSEVLVTFAIRTRSFIFRSRPNKWLLWTSAVAIALSVGICFTPIGTELFRFAKIPMTITVFIIGILLAYVISAEIYKKKFFAKFDL